MIEPIYRDALATVYQGDALELLPILPRDAFLLSDPPYGIRATTDATTRSKSRIKPGSIAVAKGNAAVGRRAYRPRPTKSVVYDPIVGDDGPFDPTPWLAWSRIVLFGAHNFAAELPPRNGWIVWDKVDGLRSVRSERGGEGFADSADAELAWSTVTGGVRIIRHRWMGMLKGSERTEARVHPAQKPVEVMARIIRRFSRPGETILDPYAGSGSTLVAAVREGHPTVGVEIVPEYAAIIVARLRAEAARR